MSRMIRREEDSGIVGKLKWRGFILSVSLCIFCFLMIGIRQAGREKTASGDSRMKSERLSDAAAGETSSEIAEPDGEVQQVRADKPAEDAEQVKTNSLAGEAKQDDEMSGDAEQVKTNSLAGEAKQDDEMSGDAEQVKANSLAGDAEQDDGMSGDAEQVKTRDVGQMEDFGKMDASRLDSVNRQDDMVQPGRSSVPEIPGTSVSEAEKRRKLLLVNKSHPVSEDYEVEMVTVEDGYLVAKQIRGGLERMLSDGRRAVPEGGFMIVSAYRSRELQAELLQDEIRKNRWQGMSERTAEWDALRTVAPAGCSEHETGLAVDIVSENDTELRESQENTEENRWLRANCWKYGFILRYPKEKEDVTGFAYEPWHFRYVGTYAAEQIMRNGLTLEEYLDGLGRNE